MPKTIGLSLALLVASSAAMAKQNQSPHHQPAPTVKAKPPAAAVKTKKPAAAPRAAAKRQKSGDKPVARSQRRYRGPERQIASGRLPAAPHAEHHIGALRVSGPREIGSAAWYGGHHVGKRTASGEPLDAVRATAAHRSLPLHSLVRVTNLGNGRSVIAKVNDRGPVSRSLLIDMSPRAAEELDMKRAGIIKVAVEPVAPGGGVGSSSER